MDDVSSGEQQQPQQQQQNSSTSVQFNTEQSEPGCTGTMAQNGSDVKMMVVDEFLNTGRTGRRNALGDILDETSAYISTADLPDQLSSLSFGADQSCSMQSTPSTSTCHQPSSSSQS